MVVAKGCIATALQLAASSGHSSESPSMLEPQHFGVTEHLRWKADAAQQVLEAWVGTQGIHSWLRFGER